MHRSAISGILALTLCVGSSARAEDSALSRVLNDEHGLAADWWVYNDIAEAREIARSENKPLFVTFRCVPCKDCKAFDAEVAAGSDVIEKLALEHFIPVRQVEMKGVDLSQFQFDYDLNWAAMFINADGTVYARYGTQSAQGPDAYNSIEGLQTTMLRVLELHKNYPNNAGELRGKRGEDKPYATALEMPGLRNKDRYRGATARNNCIHCHNIHDAQQFAAADDGTFTRDMFYRYPLPDNLGLSINATSGRKIAAVVDGSPAEDAGLKAGMEITHINGQVIASIADMQWALNPLPNAEATVTITTAEDNDHLVSLKPGWKASDFSWRGSMWSAPPQVNVFLPPLPDEKREGLDIPADQSPLEVRWINREQPGGIAAYDAGLRVGDIVTAIDDMPLKDMNHRNFMMHLKLNYNPGDTVALKVLREGRERTVRMKLTY